MRARLLALIVGCAFASGCMRQPARDYDAIHKQEVQAQLARWAKAFEAKDVDGVMAIYAPGDALTAYDIVPPLQYKGADAYRKDYAEFFAQFDGPLGLEERDQHMLAKGDLVVAYGLERISGTLKGGQPTAVWTRYTSVFQNVDGQWRDIHDHVSVPVDFATGKARLDLVP
jgi:ketosteroid isomerase-like protein